MTDFSLIELAQRALPAVAAIVAGVAFDKLDTELGMLGAYLCAFAEETHKFSPGQRLTLEKNGSLRRTLWEIEKIVSDAAPPNSWENESYPMLREIAEARKLAEEANPKTHQATSARENKIRRRVRKLARDHQNFRPAVEMLQVCTAIQKYESPDFSESTPAEEELSEYTQQAQTLYTVLRQHAICTCGTPPPANRHWARLRLKASTGLPKENQFQFEMLFSSYPDPPSIGLYDWQNVQIMVSRKTKVSKKRVKFAECTTGYATHQYDGKPLENGEFCRLIGSRCGSSLCFMVSSTQLKILPEEPCTRQQFRPGAGIPLGKALEYFGMRHGMRPVLAYILAKSVWEYYSSDWMNALWASNTIYFMEEEDENGTVSHFCKPYKLIEFSNEDEDVTECRATVGMMHKYPRILALGILLIELATGKPIFRGDTYMKEWSARTANEELGSLKKILKTAVFADDCKFPRYKNVVERCLDPGIFKNAPSNPERPQENIEKRRRIIYQEIVDPLRQLIEGTGWDAEFDELERTPLVPKDGSGETLFGLAVKHGRQNPNIEPPDARANDPKIKEGKPFTQIRSMPSPYSVRSYEVGWICAVQTEYVVAMELLDDKFQTPPDIPPEDQNVYTFGRMGNHYLAIACLAKGKYGLTSAASVAKDMMRSFPGLRFGLMVGIGGGAPSKKNDIRLGDVIVSAPSGRIGGVIHYEFGKMIQDKGFKNTGTLASPPPFLLNALQKLSALHESRGHRISETVKGMIQRNIRLRKYQRPDMQTDVLYRSTFAHSESGISCAKCCVPRIDRIEERPQRGPDENDPIIHYGLIASADRVMKDANIRDHLAKTEEVLCFEMEAAGVMDRFPCVVIRGICDYADTHKNDQWQGYAAATAAAYAKELLGVIPGHGPRRQ
ncbi:hypothetical protein FQN50_008193 [Emmonsiellopsis sp. PD_5]|nr:hypothetical protein FQN50_008193 [Emmonsiellopsis sp. PD_5]